MKYNLLSIFNLFVLAVLGLLIFIFFYDKAFPQASLDMKISKDDAQRVAQKFLEEQGFEVGDFRKAQVFDADDLAAIYLQKTLGMERANQVIRSDVPVWFWMGRFFKPLQKEEFKVFVDPKGDILGFQRALEEEKSGANLEQIQAQGKAEDFLKGRINLSEYEKVEASSEKRKERTDHTFVWKKTNYNVLEGELRLRVVVQGDEVGGFRQFFKVPEKFQRDFEKEQSTGGLLSIISFAVSLVLTFAALVVFIVKFKADDIRWKFAIVAAAVILVLFFLGQINAIPLINASYPTQIGYETFLTTIVVTTLIGGLIYGFVVLFTGASGDALTREIFPKSVESFSLSILRGYLLSFILLGYLVVFYLISSKYFGVWLPLDSPYSNMLNTSLPFLYPLLVGFSAAVSEEFGFRFFAIPFFKKYLKNILLALLIPATIWAFGHSSYLVNPVYIRGIELTIVGLILGYFYMRYGILTTIITHYVINAILVALPLLRSQNQYFLISGFLVVGLGLLPLIPTLYNTVRGRLHFLPNNRR